MPQTDERVDKYIQKMQPFAKEILEHIRKIVHNACPDCNETIKWSFPHFEYKGQLCYMSGFKEHCAFGFWKRKVMPDPDKIFKEEGSGGMGDLGYIRSKKDLPPARILTKYIKTAMKLNEAGIKIEKTKAAKAPPQTPGYFLAALKKNKQAEKNYHSSSDSMKREYIEWITEAKTEPTRLKRMATSIEWLAENKGRNWKYESKKKK